MDEDLIITAAVIAVLSAALGAVVGNTKHRVGLGFVLGLLLGPIGVLVVAVLAPAPANGGRVLCVYCAEPIRLAALVCPHCKRDIGGLPAPVDPEPGWLPDPSGRFLDRWWDGLRWTPWVRDRPGGARSEDPPVPP